MPAPDGKPHCIYPASSPQVLSCGGTEVHETASGDRHEAVWNRIPHKGRATGGGVSRLFPPPPWQSGLEIPSAAGRNARPGRVLPDVSAVAAVKDWSFVIEHGKTVLEGGTSCAAPLYAALIAQTNELRARSGLPRLGFVNKRLYALARAGGMFIDVTEGDNRTAPDAPGYAARKGYDACTGWGAPRADALVRALAAAP